MNTSELAATAHALVAKHRGILAADESTGTIAKRFDSIKLESTEENRRSYREMLFTTPGRERIHQRRHFVRRNAAPEDQGRRPFPAYLSQHGMIPGIKVDTGAKPLAGFPGETITRGTRRLARAPRRVPYSWARDSQSGAP